jgi:hypothetical protein
MPFNSEQFLAVFGRYNDAVWPMQFVLVGAGLAAIALLLGRGASNGRMISGILTLLWAWMAIAYHFAFFAAINPLAWVFGAAFLLAAIAFGWVGVVKARLRFALRGGARGWTGGVLLAYALLIYPLVGHAVGHRYPEIPTFGLPCPTTIFTLGLLMFAKVPFPRGIFAVPLLWSAVGASAAVHLGVVQDLGLVAAGVAGLAVVVQPHRTQRGGQSGGRGEMRKATPGTLAHEGRSLRAVSTTTR